MDVPDYFISKASRQFGKAGAAWALEIEDIADRCIAAWKLRDCTPINDLSINFVCTCTSGVYGDAVLKIQGPHSERYTEIEALRIFNGRNCCRILALDMERAAMLLQRVKPGTPLRALKDRDLQLSIGADMIGKLPVVPEAAHGLPSYAAWLGNAEAMLARTCAPRSLRDVLESARGQYERLLLTAEEHALLHGDLHHDNILQADGDGWLAIDPQGVIGPRVMETGRFIQNHAMEDYRVTNWPEIERTTREISRLIQEPYIRVLRALFVLHALSIAWDWEMNVDQEKLAGGLEQCGRILEAIRAESFP